MNKIVVNREKPLLLKRVVAYLIDIILVMLLSTTISMIFINNTKYQAKTEELLALTKEYTEGKITKDEYSDQAEILNYYMTKESVGTTIINCSVALVYYVILCYFCHGITLGKYLMKLQIVSANDKELNMGHYLIRGLFANLILSNLVSIIFVLTMSKNTFISVYPKVSSVLSVFLLVTMLFMMYRNDGRGLHDLMSNTKIISTKKEIYNVEEVKETTKSDVIEAKVIEEKKTTKKKTNNKKKEAKK